MIVFSNFSLASQEEVTKKRSAIIKESSEPLNRSQELRKSSGELSESSDFIINKLKDMGLIEQSSKVKVMVPRGKDARKIFFGRNKSCDLVFKLFKEKRTYEVDSAKVEDANEIIEHLNELSLSNKENMPIVIGVEKCVEIGGQGLFVQSKAIGESLKDIIDRIEKKKESEFGYMNNEEILDIFNDVGIKLGVLDKIYYQSNEQLCHPDSHLDNFIYDKENKRLYWIDTIGLKCQKIDNNNYLMRYTFMSREIRENIVRLIDRLENFMSEPEKFKDSIRDYTNKIRNYLLIVRYIYIGYISQLPDELKEQAKDNYTKLFLRSDVLGPLNTSILYPYHEEEETNFSLYQSGEYAEEDSYEKSEEESEDEYTFYYRINELRKKLKKLGIEGIGLEQELYSPLE